MVGVDRRSPPRHKAKGGGGKGKGGGSNDGLLGDSIDLGKSVDVKLMINGAEEFKFGTNNVDGQLKFGKASSDNIQPEVSTENRNSELGVQCDGLKIPNNDGEFRFGSLPFHGGAGSSPSLCDMDSNMVDLHVTKASTPTVGSYVNSWAAAVEEQEELNRALVKPTENSNLELDCKNTDMVSAGLESSASAMEHSSSYELEQQPRHSLAIHAKFSKEDISESLQAMDGAAQNRDLNPCATGMDYNGLLSTPTDCSHDAVHGLPDCEKRNGDCWMLENSGKNDCPAGAGTQGNHKCTQGVCSFASTGPCTGNAYVKTGLLCEGKSAPSSNSLPPMNVKGAVNAYVNYGFMGEGKSASCNSSLPPMAAVNSLDCGTNNLLGKGCLLGDSMVPRRTPQNYNVWKKPAHMQVDEDDLKHISDDGHSLAFDVDAYETNKGKLEKGLIGKIIGRKLPLHILDQELSRRWSFVGGFRTVLLSGDYFLCIFESMEARDKILLGGPWLILGHIIGLDKWSPDFNSDGLNGLSSPIWVRLPKLPLLFWDKKTISRIGAMIGKPLWIDAQTTIWGRCEYARVCVRMDLSKRLPTGVWIQEHSSRFFQPIEYEGISLLCFHCGIVGHKAVSCPNTHICGTNSIDGTVHSMVGTMIGDEISKNLKTAKPSGSGLSKEADSSHLEKPSMARTSGLTTQLDTLDGEKDYGPWILVTRKRKPVRNSGKFQPSNFRIPLADNIAVVPPSMDALENDGMVVESVTKDHVLKTPIDSTAIVTSQPTAGSPPHHDTTTFVESLEATTSRQSRSRSGKERVSKAHFEKELLQLGPIALKSRKRKNKVTITEAEQCLKDFTKASNSGGGDASPSKGK